MLESSYTIDILQDETSRIFEMTRTIFGMTRTIFEMIKAAYPGKEAKIVEEFHQLMTFLLVLVPTLQSLSV